MYAIKEILDNYNDVERCQRTAAKVYGKLNYVYDIEVELFYQEQEHKPGTLLKAAEDCIKYKVTIKHYGLPQKDRL